MKKIVDVNYLRYSKLREYLEEDKINYILFTELACMESFKGGSLTNIKNSLDIVSDFSDQVLVLKNTNNIMNIDLISLQQSDIFIDQIQTDEFHGFCQGVKKASAGDTLFKKRLLEMSQLATLVIDKKKDFADVFLQAMNLLNKEADQDFVKILRTGKIWTFSEYEYVWRSVVYLCEKLFEMSNKVLNRETFINQYIFRYALACYLLMLKWIGDGGWNHYSQEDMRNDFVDMSYVAYATYFDGVLSKDKKVNIMHEKTSKFIYKISEYSR